MKIKGWYVAEEDLLTTPHFAFPERYPIREGETLTLPQSVIPQVCEVGYHASPRLLDALGYRSEGRITLVEVFGDVSGGVSVGDDKVAGRSRRTLRIVPKAIADRECRLFAADVAERLLLANREAGREPPPEAFAAVEIARRFALGDADETELEEGKEAAEAAREAERAAWAAAWAAVAATTREAERGAMRAVAAAAAATKVQAPDAACMAAEWAAVAVAVAAARSARAALVKLSLELENRLLKAIGEEA